MWFDNFTPRFIQGPATFGSERITISRWGSHIDNQTIAI